MKDKESGYTAQTSRGFQGLSGPGMVVMDSAEDWSNFLHSSEADQLATQIPSEDLRKQFDVGQHAQKLDDFIVDMALTGAVR